MDIEVEGIVDVLVGGAKGDADRLEHPPDAEELEGVATQAIGADDPDLGETTGARITRKGTASRAIFERDSARDAIVLVMPEDGKRLGSEDETAGESRCVGLGPYGDHAVHRRRRGRKWRCGRWDRA